MNGIHDLGGMHGFGPVVREAEEPAFHAPWEARVFAMMLTGQIHHLRPGIEAIPPARYLASSYYERWLLALESGLLRDGVVEPEALASRTAFFLANPLAPVPRRDDPALAERVRENQRRWVHLHREVGVAPRFAAGDAVQARNLHPAGHTRLPRYVRGRRGTVARYHGVYNVPDDERYGAPEGPQPVYAVRFEARELWGPDGGGRDSVYVDLSEGHLEPVGETR